MTVLVWRRQGVFQTSFKIVLLDRHWFWPNIFYKNIFYEPEAVFSLTASGSYLCNLNSATQEMMLINRFKNGRKKMFGQNQFLSSKMTVKDVWNSTCLPQTWNVIILNCYKFLEYLFNRLNKSMYRTRTIITRGLYSFYPLFEVQKRFFMELFS